MECSVVFRRIVWNLWSVETTVTFLLYSCTALTANRPDTLKLNPAKQGRQPVSGVACSVLDSRDRKQKRPTPARMAKRTWTRTMWWSYTMRHQRTKVQVNFFLLTYGCAQGVAYQTLTIYTRNPEILLGKSSGLRHSVWEASENLGCDSRRCNFSTLFSLLRWFGYTLYHHIVFEQRMWALTYRFILHECGVIWGRPMAFTKADWPYYSCMLGAALPYSFPRPLFQIEVKCVQFPSTRVRNFLNPQLIFFRIQKFPRPHVSVFKSNLPVHTYPTRIRIHSSTQDSYGNIGNRACVEVFTVKNWTRSCYVAG